MTGPVVSATEARELLRRFAADPRALARLRETSSCRGDPLDLLRWLAEPGLVTPSGGPDPRRELDGLRTAAFDRPRAGVVDPREARRLLRCRAEAWAHELAALGEALDVASRRESRRRASRRRAEVTASTALVVVLLVTGASWWSASRWAATHATGSTASPVAALASDPLRRPVDDDPERLTETFFRLPQTASDLPPVETVGIETSSLRRTFPVSDVNVWVGRGDDGGFCLVTVAHGGWGQACQPASSAVARGVHLETHYADGTGARASWNIRDGLLQLTVTPVG
ncbi:hypothetical protein ACPEEZ_10025 [Frigoribacterium sp. 2-23]|uniref:hypothetical protein n=1 Tax=Frigoribacterium sp. 2-23 TaxID=3415006 RepID=UPI003C6FC790